MHEFKLSPKSLAKLASEHVSFLHGWTLGDSRSCAVEQANYYSGPNDLAYWAGFQDDLVS